MTSLRKDKYEISIKNWHHRFLFWIATRLLQFIAYDIKKVR